MRAVIALSIALGLLEPIAVNAAATGLPPTPPFSWGYLVPGTAVGQISATSFVTPSGGAGSGITTLDAPVLVRDVTPGDGDPWVWCNGTQHCETAGTLSLQSVLWKGVQRSMVINRVGATVMGGFTPSDQKDLGTSFGFLQIYRDAYNPGGVIDGGSFGGKVNADIPGWTAANLLRGWNYGGDAVPYDYLDIPFDRIGLDQPETVNFETALATYTPGSSTIGILADFTWGYSTLTGGLTGLSAAIEPADPSATLLDLYSRAFPDYSYQYLGGTPSSAPAPEPWAPAVLVPALMALLLPRQLTRTNTGW